MQTALQKSRSREERAGCRIYIRKRLSALILDSLKFSQNFVKVKG